MLKSFILSFTESFLNYRTLLRVFSRNGGLLLSFEVANLVLAHLSGGTFKEDIMVYEQHDLSKYSEKERSIIAYLSGYVFGTFYRRIRFSKSANENVYHQQCLAFLLAGKSESENTDSSDQKLVNAHDRGGL